MKTGNTNEQEVRKMNCGGGKGQKKDAQPLDCCVDVQSGMIERAECTLRMLLLLKVCPLRSWKPTGYLNTCIKSICM